ncbi:hypothetical protein K6U49_08545 [Vibrio alginolyticus]|uniref:hypothetical protein n=1 Tax=Vibrio alginolyticus TaxID=663 RepID=UPI001EEA0B5D|nr:hypothetical protein [Vibrio alginolyticus]MCG6308643.1 hypothetical protein [Vibrio alginolyticus]
MLFYTIVFVIIGFALGAFIKDSRSALIAIVAISVVWALVWGPWALAAFIELLVGYYIAKNMLDKQQR